MIGDSRQGHLELSISGWSVSAARLMASKYCPLGGTANLRLEQNEHAERLGSAGVNHSALERTGRAGDS